jgi:hypothetical protein
LLEWFVSTSPGYKGVVEEVIVDREREREVELYNNNPGKVVPVKHNRRNKIKIFSIVVYEPFVQVTGETGTRYKYSRCKYSCWRVPELALSPIPECVEVL